MCRTLLKEGAAALAEDAERIVYDDAAIAKLLDRSTVADESGPEMKTAFDSFTVARVWGDAPVINAEETDAQFWERVLGVDPEEEQKNAVEIIDIPRGKRAAAVAHRSYREKMKQRASDNEEYDDKDVPQSSDSEGEQGDIMLEDELDANGERKKKLRNSHGSKDHAASIARAAQKLAAAAAAEVPPWHIKAFQYALPRFGRGTICNSQSQ